MTPRSCRACSFSSVSVPGSDSKATSSHFVPGKVLLQAREKLRELLDGKERGRAAAEVDVARPPAGQQRRLAIKFRFLEHGVEVLGHAILPGVAAGVDAEVAEMAAAAAEGQVDVDAHRRAVDRRLGERGPGLLGARRRSRRKRADSCRRNNCRRSSWSGSPERVLPRAIVIGSAPSVRLRHSTSDTIRQTLVRADRPRIEVPSIAWPLGGQQFDIAVGHLDAGQRPRQSGLLLVTAEEPGDLLAGRRAVGGSRPSISPPCTANW